MRRLLNILQNQILLLGQFYAMIMKLSQKGANIFLEKFLELEKSHIGKFHNANSIKVAYLTDMLQELINSGINSSGADS